MLDALGFALSLCLGLAGAVLPFIPAARIPFPLGAAIWAIGTAGAFIGAERIS